MIFRSIRFKIILWNVVLLTLVLVTCGTLSYKYLKWNMYRNRDELLESRAAGVSESIDTYWATEKQMAFDHGVVNNAFHKANNLNFTKIASHWLENEANSPEWLNIVVQIFDSRGKLLVSSKDLSNWPHTAVLPGQVFRNSNKGYFENISININNSKSMEARSFVMLVKENDQTAYIIRLITPLAVVHTQLLHLRIILFGVLPLIIILTGVVGAFLARVSLYPVDQMIAAINRINAGNLRSHVDVPRTRDEIQRLAETFNAMLDRINAEFLAQHHLIQDMSHEIKTPLTIMRGSMEVALNKIRTPERYEGILRGSLEQIARLTNIVETLLVLAQFENHEMILERKLFIINDLMSRVLDEVRGLADGKGVVIDYAVVEQIELMAEENQIKSLLLNLLDNAIKYTPAGGRINISLNKNACSVVIQVSDTGIGIPQKDLPHIFERFFRADGPGRQEKGFGLGLSLVKSIVEAHQGMIMVTSSVSGGTSFTVTLNS